MGYYRLRTMGQEFSGEAVIRDLIDYAAIQAREDGEYDEGIRACFEAVEHPVVPWRGWIYHVPVPKDQAKVEYRDIKTLDHSAYDYTRIVNHAVKIGKAILVDNDPIELFDPVIPMFERVRAMCAYVHSFAFNSPTVFLDGDAFVNTDLTEIFRTFTDVAVTYRNDPGLMPINEGVIFAHPTEGTKRLFRAYLATYEILAKDRKIMSYYGDIKRWRGGQLTLNALTCPQGIPYELDQFTRFGCDIKYLPCHVWNYSPTGTETRQDLDAKGVVHLKGDRKRLIESVIQYQEGK